MAYLATPHTSPAIFIDKPMGTGNPRQQVRATPPTLPWGNRGPIHTHRDHRKHGAIRPVHMHNYMHTTWHRKA